MFHVSRPARLMVHNEMHRVRSISMLSCLLCVAVGACTQGVRVFDPDGGDGPDAFAPPPDAGPSRRVFVDDGIDPDIERRFDEAGASPAAPPSLVYPEDGTLIPPNLRGVDFHFHPSGFQTFEITLSQHGEPAVVVYTWCTPMGTGCTFQPGTEIWEELARRRPDGPFEVRIRGLAGDLASTPSEPIHVELADEPILGGIYFWTVEPPSIRRYEFGLARRSSELFLSGAEEGSCIGCHALSRDGSRIAVGVAGPSGEPGSRIYDVASRTMVLDAPVPGDLVSYGPTGDMLVSGAMTDAPVRFFSADGALLHDLGVVGRGGDWSADGEHAVYAAHLLSGPSELHLVTRDGDAWSEPRVIPTPTTDAEAFPAFAPDAHWISYVGTDTANPTRSLLAVLHVADEQVVHLRRAAVDDDVTFARWNPNPYSHRGRRIFWLTFSSRRDYGLLSDANRQIWMAAFDPEADPEDPSRPAFRIPAQTYGVGNFIAQWALSVRRQPCETDADCPDGEECHDGFCRPRGPE